MSITVATPRTPTTTKQRKIATAVALTLLALTAVVAIAATTTPTTPVAQVVSPTSAEQTYLRMTKPAAANTDATLVARPPRMPNHELRPTHLLRIPARHRAAHGRRGIPLQRHRHRPRRPHLRALHTRKLKDQPTMNARLPQHPVITRAVFDRDNSRVAITLAPCVGATHFALQRRVNGELKIRYFEAEQPQPVYDYTAPLNARVEYLASAHADINGMRYDYPELSAPVTVFTRDVRHWLKGPAETEEAK